VSNKDVYIEKNQLMRFQENVRKYDF